jgi:protein-tyrosine phosphatase
MGEMQASAVSACGAPGACAGTDAQRALQERFGVKRIVDVHCHCLPGLDDGPKDLAGAMELCWALANDGITDVIATPHQLGRYDGRNSPAIVRGAVVELNSKLREASVPVQIYPGADVRVDERLPRLLASDGVLTAGDSGRYILLELPHEFFIDISPLVATLAQRGMTPIVTHPERNEAIVRRPAILMNWITLGAAVQVTAGSLLGAFGLGAERIAWEWLGRGMVCLVATDAHDTKRRQPCLTETIDAVSRRLSHVTARQICVENPARLLDGDVLAGRAASARGRAR